MKRSKALSLLLSALLTVCLFTGAVFADQPNRGEAEHRESLRDKNIDGAEDTYEDLNGKERDADPDTVSISITADLERDIDLVKRAGTYANDQAAHYPRSFMLDAGNYTNAFPYSLVAGQYAPGRRMLGAARYDIAGLGTSEIGLGAGKIAQMLNKAVSSGDIVPYLTVANVSGNDSLSKAFKRYGVNDYIDMNKYRTDVAVFSVMSEEAFNSTSHNNLSYTDALTTAKKLAKEIEEDEDADIVICICNSGTGTPDKAKRLEKKIARTVEGIDLIVSTGSTTEIAKPIKIKDTRIVSLAAGQKKAGRFLYKIEDNEYRYASYKPVILNNKYKESKKVSRLMKKLEKAAGRNYFAANGFSAGQHLATSFFEIAPLSDQAGKKGDSPLGELIADSFKYSAVEDAKLPKANIIGVASDGSATGGIRKGDVRVDDVYKIMSSGRSSNGTRGEALTSFYMKGSDIVKLAEIAAVSWEDPGASRFYFSGLNYKYNPYRFKDKRIYDITVFEDDQNLGIQIADKTLYRLVCDKTTFNKVKALEEYENEDLRIKVLDENGKRLSLAQELVRFTEDAGSGNADQKQKYPLKAWAAASSYLSTFKEAGIPASYRKPDGRMVYDDSKALSHVYKGEGFTLLTMLGVALIGVAAAIVLVLLILNLAGVKTIRKKPKKTE